MTRRLNRRGFLKTGAALGAAAMANSTTRSAAGPVPASAPGERMIWGNLLHLSYNMWQDWEPPGSGKYIAYKPYLRCDRALWTDITQRMADAGMNLIVVDLGDGVKYASHPEIAVEHAWTTGELRAELKRLRGLGLEPVPKLNFSTTHDAWLGPYARMVSTDKYYGVCRELIAEVIDLFGNPRFFHLGMDEEDYATQKNYLHVVVRQFNLWWKDFLFYVEQVEKGGSRAWIWSDHLWRHPEDFFQRMPKSVVQSNWYYETDFGSNVPAVKAYLSLAEHGYDQIPTGSNYGNPKNFGLTVEFGRKSLAGPHLLGFLQTPWHPTLESCREHHRQAVDQVGAARISQTG